MNKLVEKAKSGDIEAYSELMASIKPDLVKIANKTLIDKSYLDDVLQSVYYRVYKKINTLQDNKKFKSWALTIVKNEALNVNKYVARHRETNMGDYIESLEDTQPANSSSLNFEEMISDLSEEEKTLLRLKFKEKYENAEIAEKLGMPYNTVKSKISRAIKKITLAVLILVMLSGFTVLAVYVIKQIKAHFTTSLNAINTAVENDYVQEIESDFVYDNGIGIKIDAIVLDDKNLDISFVYDVQDKSKYGEITGIGIDDYVIKSGDEVLFDFDYRDNLLIESTKQKSESFESIEDGYRNSVLFSTNGSIDIISNLNIEVKSIFINYGEENIKIIKGKWYLEHEVIEKLNERFSNSYVIEENPYVKDVTATLIDTSMKLEIEFVDEITEISVVNAVLYNSENDQYNWLEGKLFDGKKKLKISFDVGKYTENIDELYLEIPRENEESIILKLKRDL